MTESVRVQIDLSAGAVEVEAPVEAVDTIFEKLEDFIPQLAEAYKSEVKIMPEDDVLDETSDYDDSLNAQGTEEKASANGKRNRTRKSGNKRTENYNLVELKLDEGQRNDFRQFYNDKNPTAQNPQVLVIMFWLAKNADHKTLNAHEIYTGFRILDARVPAKISSVLGNLVGKGTIKNEGGGKYSLTHVGEDFVAYQLPAKKKSKTT